MSVFVPLEPKIYHIVHVDRLPSILRDGALYSDAVMRERGASGTSIGYEHIKEARLKRALWTYPDLMVGECVPFYFCPRSPMLHKVTRYPHDLNYDGGDGPILHLESDMRAAIAWASKAGRRWVFTDVSAATAYFKDYTAISANSTGSTGMP